MTLRLLHLIRLWVAAYLLEYGVYLLYLKVYDVVHHALCYGHMLAQFVEVERSLGRERMLHVAV